MDGAVIGALDARDEINRMSTRLGDYDAVEKPGGRLFGRPLARQIIQAGLAEGAEYVLALEAKCKQVLYNAHNAGQPGVPDVPTETLRSQMAAAIRDETEEAREFGDILEIIHLLTGKAMPDDIEPESKPAYRSARVSDKRWAPVIQAAKTDAYKATMKRQSLARLHTGWNRWYNRGVVQKALDNSEVIYLQFTLGRARKHTDICLAREGWVLKKDDRRIGTETPPLHWGCKSKWIPVTKRAAQKYKITRWTPPDKDDYEPEPVFGGK